MLMYGDKKEEEVEKKIEFVATKYADSCQYLTSGVPYRSKVVDGMDASSNIRIINNDMGMETYIRIKACQHLRGKNWEFIYE
jgi:hypothetical protein